MNNYWIDCRNRLQIGNLSVATSQDDGYRHCWFCLGLFSTRLFGCTNHQHELVMFSNKVLVYETAPHKYFSNKRKKTSKLHLFNFKLKLIFDIKNGGKKHKRMYSRRSRFSFFFFKFMWLRTHFKQIFMIEKNIKYNFFFLN